MLKAFLAVSALWGFSAVAQNVTPRLNCNDGDYGDRRLANHCEMKEQTFAVPGGAINVDPGMNGGVSVHGWDRNEVWMRARVQTAATTDSEARGMVPQIRLSSGAGQIHAEGPKMDDEHNWSVSYEIFAPRQSDVTVKTYNGGIHLADLRGHVEFDALNGGVSLIRLGGDIHGHTTNGGLHITLAGDRWDGKGMDVETTTGGVHLDVPASYSAHIETSTVNGGMNVEFPVTIRGKIDRELSFDVGSGGATIRARTTNGGVKINRS